MTGGGVTTGSTGVSVVWSPTSLSGEHQGLPLCPLPLPLPRRTLEYVFGFTLCSGLLLSEVDPTDGEYLGESSCIGVIGDGGVDNASACSSSSCSTVTGSGRSSSVRVSVSAFIFAIS